MKKKKIHQVGKSNKKFDQRHAAKPPGKRKADKTKKRYYEYRRNRSDLDKKKKL